MVFVSYRRTDEYKRLAMDVLERARREKDRSVRTGWENLAETYTRLADQTEGKEPRTRNRSSSPFMCQEQSSYVPGTI